MKKWSRRGISSQQNVGHPFLSLFSVHVWEHRCEVGSNYKVAVIMTYIILAAYDTRTQGKKLGLYKGFRI